MKNLMLSCDWGTSSFRLKLADIDSENTLDEVVSAQGTAVLYKLWFDQPSEDREAFYLQYLKKAVDELAIRTGFVLDQVTIVLSGMASSSLGIKELPYGGLPFPLDGQDAIVYWLENRGILFNPVLLISGVQHEQDVMRGEETQLIGIAPPQANIGDTETVWIFPGTHSKHILVKNRAITWSETYMTGEVFDLLIHKSILSSSVAIPLNAEINEAAARALRAGIERSGDTHLLNSLFSVRVNQLHHRFSKEQNYYFLSGLLIGAELRSIKDVKSKNLVIGSGSKLYEVYRLAVEQLGLGGLTRLISPEIMDKAALLGHIKILQNQKLKSR